MNDENVTRTARPSTVLTADNAVFNHLRFASALLTASVAAALEWV